MTAMITMKRRTTARPMPTPRPIARDSVFSSTAMINVIQIDVGYHIEDDNTRTDSDERKLTKKITD